MKTCSLCNRRLGSFGFAAHWAAHNRRIDHAKATTETRQDGDGHWYWIPKVMLTNFDRAVARLDGKDYMDDPDAFDAFMQYYDKYRTLGGEKICPRIFWDTKIYK